MENHLKEFLLIAESKAIATFGNNSINVVPISTINIVGEEIVLVDYFMEKTVANILDIRLNAKQDMKNKASFFLTWLNL